MYNFYRGKIQYGIYYEMGDAFIKYPLCSNSVLIWLIPQKSCESANVSNFMKCRQKTGYFLLFFLLNKYSKVRGGQTIFIHLGFFISKHFLHGWLISHISAKLISQNRDSMVNILSFIEKYTILRCIMA